MTKILTALIAAFAVVALAGTADAGSKRHGKRHMHYHAEPYGWQHDGYWSYGFRGDRYDFVSNRADPSTWTGRPRNAWDKARRDDAQLLRR